MNQMLLVLVHGDEFHLPPHLIMLSELLVLGEGRFSSSLAPFIRTFHTRTRDNLPSISAMSLVFSSLSLTVCVAPIDRNWHIASVYHLHGPVVSTTTGAIGCQGDSSRLIGVPVEAI